MRRLICPVVPLLPDDALTDADVARELRMSRGRVNQIRNQYIAGMG